MIDVSVISAGLSSVKTAIDIAKELKNADSLLKDAETKLKIADLLEALSELKVLLYETRDENQALKDSLKEIQAKLDIQGEVEFRDGHYYLKQPKEGQAPGHFCPKCYHDDNKLIPVSELSRHFRRIGKYKCPKCESVTQ
jgi:hypothetical protein